jgi:hypothetical protein
MLKRVVIGAALACLMGGAAYAVDETQPENAPAVQEPMEGAGAAGEPAQGDDECSQQLAKAEEAVTSKQESAPMSDDDYARVNELLDQADAQCTEGNLKDATATLATVNSMIGK